MKRAHRVQQRIKLPSLAETLIPTFRCRETCAGRDGITLQSQSGIQLPALTPDIPLIADPAVDPSEDVLALIEIRFPAAF